MTSTPPLDVARVLADIQSAIPKNLNSAEDLRTFFSLKMSCDGYNCLAKWVAATMVNAMMASSKPQFWCVGFQEKKKLKATGRWIFPVARCDLRWTITLAMAIDFASLRVTLPGDNDHELGMRYYEKCKGKVLQLNETVIIVLEPLGQAW